MSLVNRVLSPDELEELKNMADEPFCEDTNRERVKRLTSEILLESVESAIPLTLATIHEGIQRLCRELPAAGIGDESDVAMSAAALKALEGSEAAIKLRQYLIDQAPEAIRV